MVRDGKENVMQIYNIFLSFFTLCHLLESPQWGDSNEMSQCIVSQIVKKKYLKYSSFSPIGQEYPFLQVSEIFLSLPAISA